jgi:arylsulfatase A-like enzyme/Flp pilus assembly protein TadD
VKQKGFNPPVNIMKKIAPLLLTLSFCAALPAAAADTNLLLITVDTLRPDRLGCYSQQFVRTAEIDSLAARGALFERAFAHNPMTLPSHTNIHLGLLPTVHGVSENSRSVVTSGFTTLAEVLKEKGYETGAFISAFPLDSRFGLDQGFDVYDDAYGATPDANLNYSERPAEKTVAAARAWLAGRKGKWFCWVHLWDPHAPYIPPEPFKTKYAADPYSGEVAYVDQELGKILADGKAGGWLDRTVIVLTGDHGEGLGEHGEAYHGYFAYNTTIHIPLLMAGPGIKPSRIKEAVGHIDIFPTVCDLLNIAPPAGLQGESLAPALAGKSIPARPIYIESLEPYLNRGWAPLHGFIENGKKFIDLPIPELYDLEKDPEEKTNLASGTDLAAFRKKLDELRQTGGQRPAAGSRRLDAETRERLRSLGYLVSPVTNVKAKFGPEDDLKTLAPLEQRLSMAETLRRQGKIAESVKLYEDLIKAKPDFAAPYDYLYQLYRMQNLVEEGLAVLERGYKANPDNYILVAGYGMALVRAGKLDAGAAVLEKAAGEYDQDAEVWHSLGLAAFQKGNSDKALEYFERALALAPGDALINDNMGTALTRMAMQKKSVPDLEKAQAAFQAALAADPNLASAHNGLGGVYMIMGLRDEAIQCWEKAVALKPNYDMALYNLGLAYLGKGDKDAALKIFRRYQSVRGRSMTAAEQAEINSLIQQCLKK